MAFLQRNGADDLLFPQSDASQTRYRHMTVLMFSGANAPMRMAQFIRDYTNADGTQGLPSSHIGATSPYIDGGNMFYIYYHDNAQVEFTQAMGLSAGQVTAAEALRTAAKAANKTLIANLQGSDGGWRS
tara:strand:- start:5723 stop:6109 length:387 start_codon:yes stop_codon:yes gene_type:complete